MIPLLICIVAVSALTLVTGVALTQTRQTYSGKADGVVYRAETSSTVFYRYNDHLNNRHEGRSQLILNSNPFPAGMHVTVRYDPKDARKFYVEEERRMQTKMYTIVIVSLLVLLLVLSSIYVTIMYSNHKEVIRYEDTDSVQDVR